MNKVFLYFLVSVLTLSFHASFALKDVELRCEKPQFWFENDEAQFFEDTSSELTLHEIISNNLCKDDLTNDFTIRNFSSAYWIKFNLSKKKDCHENFRVEIFDFNIDEISLFSINENGIYEERKSGYIYSFEKRETKHKNVSFGLPFLTNTPTTFYMRFKSSRNNILKPVIRTTTDQLKYGIKEYLFFGLFFGLLLLILIYNLIYFFTLKEGYYLFYFLYIFGIVIYLMSTNGVGFQFLWPNYPSFNLYASSIGLLIFTSSLLLFTTYFFKLKNNFPHLFKISIYALILRITYFLLVIIFPFLSSLIIDILYIQLIIYIGFKVYLSGLKSAKWFLWSFTFLNLSLLISALEIFFVLPSYFITVNNFYLGISFQFIILSIGIAESHKFTYSKKNELQEQLIIELKEKEILKDKVQNELEDKVRQRTLELEQSKKELEFLNQETTQMNITLDLLNLDLRKDLKQFAQNSILKTFLSFDEFKQIFPDNLACKRILLEIKENQGFICKKCSSTTFVKGKEKFDKRCSKCGYNDSLTANTIFHKNKAPLQKTFYLLYLVTRVGSNIVSKDIASTLELNLSTVTNFKKKVEDRMKQFPKEKPSWDKLIINISK